MCCVCLCLSKISLHCDPYLTRTHTMSAQLWTAEEDAFLVSHLCFLPKTDWPALLVAYGEKARELPRAFPKV